MTRCKSKLILGAALLASLAGVVAGCHYHDYDDHRHGYYGRRWDDRYYDRRYDWRYDRDYDNRYSWRYRDRNRYGD